MSFNERRETLLNPLRSSTTTQKRNDMKQVHITRRLFLLACALLGLSAFLVNGSREVARAAISGSASISALSPEDADRLAQFEQTLESLRQRYKIPGLSAAIVSNQRIIWERGFGFQDLENRVAATPDTPYHIASLTKTFASMLLMKCVEQGKLNLDDPINKYTFSITQPGVTVRHLFTHTSESTPPGEKYAYNGNRYFALTSVVDACGGQSYREALARTILDRLEMLDSAPGRDLANPSSALTAMFTPETLARYASVVQRTAKPYRLDSRGQLIPSAYPESGINASSGLISTVRDLARYDAAIDRHLLLQAATQETAWTNHRNSKGQALPYGLGWFVQNYFGQRLIWHYGNWPDAFSALILKVPGRNVTLILLANSGGLSAFPIGNGDVTTSPFANAFLSLLNDPDAFPKDTAAIVSAASYLPDAAAPEAIVAAFGQQLATETAVASSLPLPTELAGTSVRVDGLPAPLFYVSPQQVNFLIPASAQMGVVAIEITSADGTISRSSSMLTASAPGLFTANGQGHGAPVAMATSDGVSYRLVANPDGTLNPLDPGEYLVMFGTGIRGAATETVKINLGGMDAPVLYAGRQPDLAGLDQVNTQIPIGLSGMADVVLSISGRAANLVKVMIR